MDEIPRLVCLRVTEATIGSVVGGSVQDVCIECSHPVWVSQSGQALLEKVCLCLECSGTTVKDLTTATLVPGALQEVANYDPDIVPWFHLVTALNERLNAEEEADRGK